MKYLISFALICLIFNVYAEGPVVEKKEIHKTFQVNSGVDAKVISSFGNISYKIGTENKVTYDAVVIVDGRDKSKVQTKLNSISIRFDQSSGVVTGKTIFEDVKVNNVNVKINYIVTIPASASINISSNYVDIHLPITKNNVTITGNYTDVYANEPLNELNFTGSYCDLFINNIQNLQGNGSYIDLEINNISSLKYSGAYCDMKILNGEKLDIIGAYTDVEVNKTNSLKMNGSYCHVEVLNGKSLDIGGAYTDVKIQTADNVVFVGAKGEVSIQQLNKSARLKGDKGDFTIRNMGPKVTEVEIGGALADAYAVANYNSYVSVSGSGASLDYSKQKYKVKKTANINGRLEFEANTGNSSSTKITIVGAKIDVILK